MPAEWTHDPSAAAETNGPKLSLETITELVRQPKTLQAGETRLVGLIDHPLPGLKIDPAASQSTRGGTLVVVNLQYPALTASRPLPDKNTHLDIATPREERESEMDQAPDDLPDSES